MARSRRASPPPWSAGATPSAPARRSSTIATARVRRPRLRGRPGRRDRRAHPHDQADALLLLRQQGRPLPGRAGARLPGIRSLEQESRRRAPPPRRGPCARSPSSRSTTTSRTRTSSGWSASRTSTTPSTCAPRRCSPGSPAPAVDVLGGILERGRAAGLFRDDVDALDVHMVISAFCVFRTANRHTFQPSSAVTCSTRPPRALPADARRPVVEYLTAHVGRA